MCDLVVSSCMPHTRGVEHVSQHGLTMIRAATSPTLVNRRTKC